MGRQSIVHYTNNVHTRWIGNAYLFLPDTAKKLFCLCVFPSLPGKWFDNFAHSYKLPVSLFEVTQNGRNSLRNHDHRLSRWFD